MLQHLMIIDYVFFVILLIAIIKGFIHGFVKEVISLLAWIAALIFASLYTNVITSALAPFIKTPAYRTIIGIVAIIALTLAVTGLLKNCLSKLIEGSGVGFFNRLFGAVFGACKIFILVLTVTFLIQLAGMSKASWWSNAYISTYFEEAALTVKVWVYGYKPKPKGTMVKTSSEF